MRQKVRISGIMRIHEGLWLNAACSALYGAHIRSRLPPPCVRCCHSILTLDICYLLRFYFLRGRPLKRLLQPGGRKRALILASCNQESPSSKLCVVVIAPSMEDAFGAQKGAGCAELQS